jgi:hypothetical protein
VGNYISHAPSPEPERVIIYFFHLKEVGSTTSNWFVFGENNQNPVAFVGK